MRRPGSNFLNLTEVPLGFDTIEHSYSTSRYAAQHIIESADMLYVYSRLKDMDFAMGIVDFRNYC